MKLNDTYSSISTELLDSLASGVLVIGPAREVLACNRRLREIWHIPQGLRTEQAILDFISQQLVDQQGFVRRIEQIEAAQGKSSFDVLDLRDGRIVELYSEAQSTEVGKRGRVWSFHDVSQVLEQERPESRSGFRESVSRLAAGVAHDFTSLFGIIQHEVKGLVASPRMSGRDAEAAIRIAQAAQRAIDLAAQLHGFGRKSPAADGLEDLNGLVSRVIHKLKPALPGTIEVLFEPSTEQPDIRCDSGMIEQALTNLILNASEAAVPDAGHIRISTGLAHVDAAHVRNHREARPGTFATISVSDNGCGIDSITLGRIFRPFFTTKKAERRAGLGLSKVFGIVQLHRGWIQVTSQPGYGSVFSIYLPAACEIEVSPLGESPSAAEDAANLNDLSVDLILTSRPAHERTCSHGRHTRLSLAGARSEQSHAGMGE